MFSWFFDNLIPSFILNRALCAEWINTMQITLNLTEQAAAVVNAAIADNGQNANDFVLEFVEKALDQKRVAFARQRLNIGKKLIAQLIAKNVKGYESLEQAYITQGMSNDVDTYGGIRKVFEDIYQKSGVHVDAVKIRLNNVVAVNAPK